METREYTAIIIQSIEELDRLAKEFSAGWDRIEQEAQKIRDETDDRIRRQIKMLEGNHGVF